MESELRILAGWEKESGMPATYVHLAGADVDKKLLIKNGLITDDEKLVFKTLKPGKCPRCGVDNPVDAKYCSTCGLIINKEAAIMMDTRAAGMALELMDLIQKEPRLLEMLKNVTNTAEQSGSKP